MLKTQRHPLIEASIYLKGTRLNPEKVTQILGVQPSSSQTKGGSTATSKRFVAKIGMWECSVKSDCRPAAELVDELFLKFGSSTAINTIEGVEDAHLDLFFATDDENGPRTIEFVLNHEQVAKLNTLGLALDVTVM